MQYLGLSILSSSLIFVIFKLYTKYRIQTLYAIITNYIIACGAGLFFYNGTVNLSEIPTKPWFLSTIALGILFIVVFNLMAATSQKMGVSVASIATKMSLVVPVLFGIIMFDEHLSFLQTSGIILALFAVYLATTKEKNTITNKHSLLLPLLVFLGSGAIDTCIKFAQETYIKEKEFPLFSAIVFGSAACTGILFIIFKTLKNPIKINIKNILGGICLGIPNYFSIYFLMKALDSNTLNSASIFTLNNVAIVMLSTLLGIILFQEKISPKNWIGIALSVTSIILVAFGNKIQTFLFS
ncbi:DMT family transporter [Maribacter sp. MMG018]|uniref:GRP family sugar transporter n=1 Tax=Maribacter sp. MMG018 TaxID=2822688 RepID=UPI001B360981|nr:GRP family sugar transporter [Maribacter sp. MMG018]MBQ4914895.1 DMT family transporter [Maribacter sp. MMG018]